LDDWVLCRLYNKKNEWEKMQLGKGSAAAATKEEAMDMTTSHSHSHSHSHSQSHSHSWGETRTPESEIVDNDPFLELDDSFPAFQDPAAAMMVPKVEPQADDGGNSLATAKNSDLFVDLSYDDIQSMYSGLDLLPPPGEDLYSSLFASPRVKGNHPAAAAGLPPF
jgi:hypothetical protein